MDDFTRIFMGAMLLITGSWLFGAAIYGYFHWDWVGSASSTKHLIGIIFMITIMNAYSLGRLHPSSAPPSMAEIVGE